MLDVLWSRALSLVWEVAIIPFETHWFQAILGHLTMEPNQKKTLYVLFDCKKVEVVVAFLKVVLSTKSMVNAPLFQSPKSNIYIYRLSLSK